MSLPPRLRGRGLGAASCRVRADSTAAGNTCSRIVQKYSGIEVY
jgi:hypothetical protein